MFNKSLRKLFCFPMENFLNWIICLVKHMHYQLHCNGSLSCQWFSIICSKDWSNKCDVGLNEEYPELHTACGKKMFPCPMQANWRQTLVGCNVFILLVLNFNVLCVHCGCLHYVFNCGFILNIFLQTIK